MTALLTDLLGPYAALAPEGFLGIAALGLLMLGVARADREDDAGNLVGWLAVLALAATGGLVLAGEGSASLFRGSFVTDDFSRFIKLLILAGSALALMLSFDYAQRAGFRRFEFGVLVLIAAIGMLLMVSAGDLIVLYVSLELQSLALYVLAAIRRDSGLASEAGLKYFVLGALSSGLLLYGASLIYGATGSVNLAAIAAMIGPERNLGLVFGLVFLLAGLAFKVSAVPFHMWTPDVYQGAPTPVTALFAGAPKIAALALIIRVLMDGFRPAFADWQQIVIALALLSMALGSLAAIGQSNVKRLLAYSSIGHVGYALVGLAAGTEAGIRGMLVYLALYLAMTLGAFGVLVALRRGQTHPEAMADFSGLARTHPGQAFVMAAMMFSLAGIPPLAGFFAKFYVFLAAVEAGLTWLAIAGVVLSVIGAFYYLRLVKVMYFDAPTAPYEPAPAAVRLVLALATAVTLLFVVWPAPLVDAAGVAARSLF